MASRRSFGVFVVSSAMLVLTVTGGIAGATPARADKCVARPPALAHSTAPAAQRYAEYKQAQLERMDASINSASVGTSCQAVTKVASQVIRRPGGYAAFKDLQAGN